MTRLAAISSSGPVHRSLPVHRSIVAVDIEQSTRRSDSVKAELRENTYRLLQEAMTYAGIEPRHCDPFTDRGDGILVLIHPTDEVPKTFLLSQVVPELARLVADYNLSLPTEAWRQRGLRLRAVVHAGEIHYDGRGYFGEALNMAFRLLDAPQVKAHLRKVAAPLILVVSEEIYRGVVRHQCEGIDPSKYSPEIQVQVAGRSCRGYIHVPADAFESLTVDSATGAIVPPATPFFNQLERHLIQAEEPFDLGRGLADLNRRLRSAPDAHPPSGVGAAGAVLAKGTGNSLRAEAASPYTKARALVSPREFEEFFRNSFQELVRTAMIAGATTQEAEDAAAKTLADILVTWKEREYTLTWARRAVVHNFIKAKTRGPHRVVQRLVERGHVPLQEGTEDSQLTALEDDEWVTALLSILPPAQREVMACIAQGLDRDEIAARLGKSREAIRRILCDARTRLIAELHSNDSAQGTAR